MNIVKRILCYPALLINLVIGSGLLISAYSPFISPVTHPFWACAGLFFPLFLVANFFCLLYWLFLHRYWALLPVFLYASCWGAIRTYIPFNRSHQVEATARTIDFISYNVMYLYTSYDVGHETVFPILEYLKEKNADIVCLQEFPMNNKKALKAMGMYPYRVMEKSLACFSKYPILSHRLIDYESVYNGSMMVEVKVDDDTLLVINNHLESNKLDSHDKSAYRSILESPDKNKVKTKGKYLLKKLAEAVSIRGPQADSVAKVIRQNTHDLKLVCGDFNDSPISYAHRVIGKGLQDAFVEAGNGMGFSYNRSSMYFRIDHVFASNYFKVVDCEVDNKIKASDHYPVWCRFKILNNHKSKKEQRV